MFNLALNLNQTKDILWYFNYVKEKILFHNINDDNKEDDYDVITNEKKYILDYPC